MEMIKKQYDPDALRDTIELLRHEFPTYEDLLISAAKFQLDICELTANSSLLNIILEIGDIDAAKTFFLDHPELGDEALYTLYLTERRRAQAKGSNGGKKRAGRYQEIDSKLTAAYLSDDAAQAAKFIDTATYKFMANHPDLCKEVKFPHVRKLISQIRKNAK